MGSTGRRSRREVLKGTAVVAAGAAVSGLAVPAVHAAGDETIRVALVGCGGRGTGAAVNALSTSGPTKLVALADVFKDRTAATRSRLMPRHGKRVDVPDERLFSGFDAYKGAIDAVGPGGVVLLATPPAFRPAHLEYAVEKGAHVFMEKSFAVDAPGIRRVLKAGEVAQRKNLKVAGGLMCRHNQPLEEAVRRIHDGAIGEVMSCFAYREHGPVGVNGRQPGESEVSYQVRNYSCFTWLNGSFLLDWLIHNLDVCCWIKNAWPVSCQGQGGRQVRTDPDQLFDHYLAEYTFPDGGKLVAQGRHMNGCWNFFGSQIFGTRGTAILGEGIALPKLYKGWNATKENVLWAHPGPEANPYQHEHDLLFAAIRKDQPYNETDRCAKAAMTGILGRMAIESGQMVTWEKALASDLELAPGLEKLTLDGPAPVMPDAQGKYPVAMPGRTRGA